jgi:hypothetical protein
VIAALSFTLGAFNAQADQAGIDALKAKVATIPGYPTSAASVDLLKVKAADLVYAVALVLEDPAFSGLTAANVAASALEKNSLGKARSDKDKIAGQIVAQAIASRGLSDEGTLAGNVVVAVYNVNAGSNVALKATGQSAAVAAGLQAVDQSDPSEGEALGAAVAAGVSSISASTSGVLLQNVAKTLGKTTSASVPALVGFVDALITAGKADLTTIGAAALKVAGSNPAAAGAFYGGFVESDPTTGTEPPATAGELQSFSLGILSNRGLTKARGEILANIVGSVVLSDAEKSALANALYDSAGSSGVALVAQGLLRAGSADDVNEYLSAFAIGASTASSRAKLGGVIAVGNGGDEDKLENIVTALQGGILTSKDRATVASSIVNAFGAVTPDGAAVVAEVSAAPFANNDAELQNFGNLALPKIKATAAAGALGASLVEDIIADAAANAKVSAAGTQAALFMAKASKAATDIARESADIAGVSGSSVDFAEAIADSNKRFVLNAAVGVSMADSPQASEITLRAITHDVQANGTKIKGDTAALAQSAKIAGAVASAVDVEQATFIGAKLSNVMSVTPTVAKPIKLSTLTQLATSLGKAIQSKPNVTSSNRGDELGELAAVLTRFVIGKYGTDARGQAAESKAIVSIGSTLFKTLSKKLLNQVRTLAADQTVFFDLAGSISRTIWDAAQASIITDTQRQSLVTALLAGLPKLAGKTGSTAALNITNAITAAQANGNARKFESGFDFDLANTTDTSILNDPETDKLDAIEPI